MLLDVNGYFRAADILFITLLQCHETNNNNYRNKLYLILYFFFFEIQNYETINYKLYRSISICTLVLFDILYDIVHVCTKKEPQVSWQAHFFGGISGIFLG